MRSPRERRWAELDPDARLLRALDEADAGGTYEWAESAGTVDDKRNWSNRFADACARMTAPIVRGGLNELGAPSDLVVLPRGAGRPNHR